MPSLQKMAFLLFMNDEEINQDITVHPDAPVLKDIIIIYLLSGLLLIVFGPLLQELHLLIGLVITELAFIVAPPLLYTIRYKYHLSQTFQIAPIPFKTVWLTVVTTAAAFVLIGVVAMFQEQIFPRPQNYQELWEQVLKQFHQIPLILTFALVAMLPGICEELFFRGFLLHGIRKKLADRDSILLVGILFGVFHLDPYRFCPVTLLGILFGYMVTKTGSIFTGMIAHITNNTIAILISYAAQTFQKRNLPLALSSPEEIPLFQIILALIPLIGIALTIFVVGLRALPRTLEK
jgi:sodium transport system permease protein